MIKYHICILIKAGHIVLEEVRSNTGLSLTSAQIERVIKNMPCILDGKAKAIVEKQGKMYIDKLLRSLMESGFDVTAIPTVFLGGGAALVEKNVDINVYAQMEFIKDIRANAIAFEAVAKLMIGDKM
jgi:plasmid segregation protein ParM